MPAYSGGGGLHGGKFLSVYDRGNFNYFLNFWVPGVR